MPIARNSTIFITNTLITYGDISTHSDDKTVDAYIRDIGEKHILAALKYL